MFEDVTYDEIMTRMLDRIRTDYPEVDTREGSLVYTAIAPAAIELAIMYSELDRVMEEAFAETASLEYLEKRTAERGITQRLATHAVMEASINQSVPIGTRFSLDEYTFVVINNAPYQLECETPGSAPNILRGELTPIEPNLGLTAKILDCIIPGEDDEDVEELRARYFEALNVQPYGFNIQQYREVTNSMAGVGATKVFPAWNGGGTVRLMILNSDYKVPSSDQVSAIQTAIDPIGNKGEGLGLAPIGHVVTVSPAVATSVDIICTFEYQDTYTWETVKENVYAAIDNYFAEMAKTWETDDMIVRINRINQVLMSVPGIVDVKDTKLNGGAYNLFLPETDIPVRGGINGFYN